MDLSNLSPAPGSRTPRKRIGRGYGSGKGKTSGFGQKGQKARSGHHKAAPHFMGGQTSMSTQLPYKRGFKNRFKKYFQVVNLERLGALETDLEVTPEVMAAAGIIRDVDKPVKVLGNGQLSRALRVSAHAFSQSARSGIEAAGGSVTVLDAPAETETESDSTSGDLEGAR